MPRQATAKTNYQVVFAAKGGAPSITVSNITASDADRAIAVARAAVRTSIETQTPTVS